MSSPARPSDAVVRSTRGRSPKPSGLGCVVVADKRRPGMVVQRVHSRSRASQAGIQENDVLVEINHMNISSLQDMLRALESASPDTSTEIKLLRNNATINLFLPVYSQRHRSPAPAMHAPSPTPFGMIFEKNHQGLVVVTNVSQQSISEICGLQRGDVLLAIQNRATTDMSERDVGNLLARVPQGAVVQVTVRRGSDCFELAIERSPPQLLLEDRQERRKKRGSSPQHADALRDARAGLLTQEELESTVEAASSMKKQGAEITVRANSKSTEATTATDRSPLAGRSNIRDQIGSFDLNEEKLSRLLARVEAVETSAAMAESQRAEAETRRQQQFQELCSTLDSQSHALEALMQQALLRERELQALVRMAERSEETRREAEEVRETRDKQRETNEAMRREEEQRRKNGELERHMLVKQHETALDSFKRNMQKSEGEAWGRLGVLIDSLKTEKANVRTWVDKLTAEHSQSRDKIEREVSQLLETLRGVGATPVHGRAWVSPGHNQSWNSPADDRRGSPPTHQFDAVEAALRQAQEIMMANRVGSPMRSQPQR